MFAFLKFFNPKWIMYGFILLIVTVFSWKVYDFVMDSIEYQKMVIQQELTIQLQENEIKTLNDAIDQAADAQRMAEITRRQAEISAAELRQVRDAAQNTGEENDSEIAPVLGDTLRALRQRMQ